MVVLAPWSSLTLPSGRAKPLVRGEGNPAACPQEESWGVILILSSRKGFSGEHQVVDFSFSPSAYCRIPRGWGGKD